MFPELRRWVKDRFADRGEPISLGLKQLPFDGVSAGFYGQQVDWYWRNGYYGMASMLGSGMPTWSGEIVTVQTALSHSVVWACVGLISRAIGFMPALVMRETKQAGKQEAHDHPMYEAWRYQPNEEISAQSFCELLTTHCLLQGNGFAKIVRRSGTGTAIELQPLLPQQVNLDRDAKKRLVYVIKNETGSIDNTYTVEPGKPHDIFHLPGLSWNGKYGLSVIEVARQSIGSALAAERNIGSFWANGGRIPYVLQKMKFRDDTAFDDFRKKWTDLYANPHLPPILEGDGEYKQTGLSMRDAQAIEFRQAEIAEICRWFNVSPTLVGDASRSTFNNQEQYMVQFVRMSLQDWMSRFEQSFRRCILTPQERSQGYFLLFDERQLLRGDFAAQMTGFATALQNGYLSIDEVRDEMGYNPLDNGAGSHHHIQLNMQTLPDDGSAPMPQPQQQPPTKNLLRLV